MLSSADILESFVKVSRRNASLFSYFPTIVLIKLPILSGVTFIYAHRKVDGNIFVLTLRWFPVIASV